jgi:hypothetical protein
MAEHTCETCRYWDPWATEQSDAVGTCRRHAPMPDERDGSARWAFTEDVDWCGDHQPRKRDS